MNTIANHRYVISTPYLILKDEEQHPFGLGFFPHKLVDDIIENARKCAKEISKDFRATNEVTVDEQIRMIFIELICLFSFLPIKAMKSDGEKVVEKFKAILIESVRSEIFRQSPNGEEFVIQLNQRLHESYFEYLECESLFLGEGEDYTFADKKATGVKSRGMVNRLTDALIEKTHTDNPITHARWQFIVLYYFKAFTNK